jgi:GAF domain-containing protein
MPDDGKIGVRRFAAPTDRAARLSLHTPYARLQDLAAFLAAGEDLRASLDELAERAAGATGAASCSIMLLSEGEDDAPKLKLWCATGALPAAAWEEAPGPGESIAGRVLASGEPLLVPDIARSGLAPLARPREGLGNSLVCVPITVAGRAIGVMNLANRAGAAPFDSGSLGLATIVAALIGKSVQVERLQALVRSRVAQASLVRQEQDVARQLTGGTTPPARVAKILAKSFFKDLRAAGFEPGQIIDAASEIISLVSRDIGRYRRRISRDSGRD